MKAHISDKEQLFAQIEALQKTQLDNAALNGLILGAKTAMKLAADRYADRIRNGTPEESHAAALELLDYLTEKSEGLKGVGEGKADEQPVD